MKKLCMILPLALILCFIVGCQDKAAMAELEEFKAQAALEEQNIEIVGKGYKMIDEGNIEGLMELFAPNFLWYAPSNSPTPWSKEESGELLVMLLNTYSGYTEKIEEIIAVGDKVIARVNSFGTHTGEYLGIPATGKKVEYSSINIFSLKDGKIVEVREDYDSVGLMQQLGMELKPKEGEK
jgi:steroid delta-isomerase-like uncharacterized protein